MSIPGRGGASLRQMGDEHTATRSAQGQTRERTPVGSSPSSVSLAAKYRSGEKRTQTTPFPATPHRQPYFWGHPEFPAAASEQSLQLLTCLPAQPRLLGRAGLIRTTDFERVRRLLEERRVFFNDLKQDLGETVQSFLALGFSRFD